MVLSVARVLRRRMTDAKMVFWQRLSARQVHGYKFRRQHPIGSYIVDFICLEKFLVIEVDGSQHLDNEQYDRQRTQILELKGYQVIRFWNHDVLRDPDAVLEQIAEKLTSPSPWPSP